MVWRAFRSDALSSKCGFLDVLLQHFMKQCETQKPITAIYDSAVERFHKLLSV